MRAYFEVPGRVMFFTSGVGNGAENAKGRRRESAAGNETSSMDEAIIRLPGVDDTYPPQKKSFAMLRWWYDNYVRISLK